VAEVIGAGIVEADAGNESISVPLPAGFHLEIGIVSSTGTGVVY